LSAEEAQALRELHPSVSPWRIVSLQLVVGVLVALAAWGFTGKPSTGWSAGYGALAVVIPAVLFARGLMSQFSSINAATAGFGFFVWKRSRLPQVSGCFLPPRSWLQIWTGWLC